MLARRGHLRLLALSVEELAPAKFGWCLRESVGDPVVFEVFQRAPIAFNSYAAALADGTAHWQRLVSADGDHGPRSVAEDENADPVGARVTTGPLRPPGKLSKHKLAEQPASAPKHPLRKPANDAEKMGDP